MISFNLLSPLSLLLLSHFLLLFLFLCVFSPLTVDYWAEIKSAKSFYMMLFVAAVVEGSQSMSSLVSKHKRDNTDNTDRQTDRQTDRVQIDNANANQNPLHYSTSILLYSILLYSAIQSTTVCYSMNTHFSLMNKLLPEHI